MITTTLVKKKKRKKKPFSNKDNGNKTMCRFNVTQTIKQTGPNLKSRFAAKPSKNGGENSNIP